MSATVGLAAILGLAVALALGTATPLRARPVPIGRHVELAYGISASHPHPMPGGGPRRAFTAQHAAPEQTPRRRWVAEVGRGRTHAPVVSADGTLFVASATGLAGLSPDGASLFRLELGLVPETPSLDPRGDLVVGVVAATRASEAAVPVPTRRGDAATLLTGDGRRGALVVVDPRGVLVGASRVSVSPWSSPLVLDDGSIVVPGVDGVVRRLHAEGPLLFELPLDGAVRSLVAERPSHDLVVVVDGRIVFFSPEGRFLGRFVLGDGIHAGPAVGTDGTVWVVTAESFLFGIDLNDAVRVRAELDLRSGRATALALGPDGAVWVGSSEGALVCFEPGGSVRFRSDSIGGAVSGLVVDPHGVAVVVDDRGGLSAIAPAGTVRWRVDTGARTQAAPVIAADGTLYVATLAGTVQAWR